MLNGRFWTNAPIAALQHGNQKSLLSKLDRIVMYLVCLKKIHLQSGMLGAQARRVTSPHEFIKESVKNPAAHNYTCGCKGFSIVWMRCPPSILACWILCLLFWFALFGYPFQQYSHHIPPSFNKTVIPESFRSNISYRSVYCQFCFEKKNLPEKNGQLTTNT